MRRGARRAVVGAGRSLRRSPCAAPAPARAASAPSSGNLIVSLDGGLSPLKLPRDRPAPVAVHLEGGLRTADGSLLPRVTRIELGLPGQGVLSTRGLPTCSAAPPAQRDAGGSARRLPRRRWSATAASRPRCVLPNQQPFAVHARLLAFNGRVGGRRAVLLHAFAASPPTVVVLPFLDPPRQRPLRDGAGRQPAGGAGPLAALRPLRDRRSRAAIAYRGRRRSYLSASCPIPKQSHRRLLLLRPGQLHARRRREDRHRHPPQLPRALSPADLVSSNRLFHLLVC